MSHSRNVGGISIRLQLVKKLKNLKQLGALGFDFNWLKHLCYIMLENETCSVIFRHCEMR